MPEFRTFVEETESELWLLFKGIDRDRNGRLDKEELKLAFEKANIAINNSKLDHFFNQIDTNHDGVISFDEWRYVYCPVTINAYEKKGTF
jgi:solute carrier family 25 (mitochondrial phosphate transporter), member 23/24/25/41